MKSKIKQLATQTALYGFFTIFGRFLTFFLTPIYANYLSKQEVGVIELTFTLVAFFNIFYGTAFESAFFRFYNKDNLEKSRIVFSNAFISILLIGLLVSLVIVIFSGSVSSSLFNGFDNAHKLVVIACFIPLFDALSFIPFALLRLNNKVKEFVIIRFISAFIALVGNSIIVIYLELGVIEVFTFQLATSILVLIFVFKEIIKNFILKIDFSILKEMFLYGFPTLPASIATIFLNVGDRIMVKEMTNVEDLAIYGASYKFGIPMLLFVSAFEYAWKPFYLNSYKDKDSKLLFSRIFTYFFAISVFVFLFVTLFLDYIIMIPFPGGKYLLPPDYWEGTVIVPIILLAYLVNGLYNNFAAGLHITKQTKFFPISIITGASVYFLFMYWLLPEIGYIAAAYATLIGYTVNMFMIYYFSNKNYKINYEWTRIIKILVVGLIIYLFMILYLDRFEGEIKLIIRILLLFIYFVALKFSGFFNKAEINTIKRLFKK